MSRDLKSYDYVIVGAGPCGILLAWGLARHTKSKILLLDREESIGGCHRVRRVNRNSEMGLFTEHGPRIYVTNYFLLSQMMNEMGLSWSNYFTGYTEMTRVFGDMSQFLGYQDYLKFVPEFLYMMLDGGARAMKISVASWARSVGMSRKQIDFLDRICRLTDGAGVDRYTLFEFLQLVNQNGLYKIQQPKLPLDIGLWSIVHDKLVSAGVEVRLGVSVESLIDGGQGVGGHPVGVWVNDSGLKSSILGRRVILAVPPKHLVNLLDRSGPELRHSFGNLEVVKEWERDVRYIPYIPITFHWKSELTLPPTWGYPRSSWGVAFIPLTDYTEHMKHSSEIGQAAFGGMGTVMTLCISKADTPSPVTGLTAHQTRDQELLMEEAFRQLRESYPDLPPADEMILSPGVSRSVDGKRWETRDSAFMLTSHGYAGDDGRVVLKNGFQSKRFLNLYWCGVQNGRGKYHFTAMESAMGNAAGLLHILAPSTRSVYPIQDPLSLSFLIWCGFGVLVILLWWIGFGNWIGF